MDIQSIIQDDKKKKFLIIGLIAFFVVIGLIFFLTRSSDTNNEENGQFQLLEDFAKLSPRSGVATSSLSQMPKIALLADRTTVDPGQPVKISWEARNAESCVDINGDELGLTGSLSVSPKEPYTFDILCTGPEGTDLQSITIAVTGFPSIALYAYPDVVKSGEQSVISWEATNADRCIDSTGKVLRLSGGLSVTPKIPYTFSMSCTGPKGTTNKSVTVSIAKPLATGTTDGTTGGTTSGGTTGGTSDTGFDPWASISSLLGGGSDTAQEITLKAPTNVEYKATAKVEWTLKNVDPLGCVFSNTVPNSWLKPLYPSSGSVTSSPLYESQTITISCTKGTANIQKSTTITVAAKPIPPDPNFTAPLKASPEYTATGEQVTLSWAAKNATTCSLIKDNVVIRNIPGKSSSVSIWEATPGTRSYTLECKNADGVIVKSGPVSVSVVNCRFTNGFGATDAEAKKIVTTKDDPNLNVERDGLAYGLGSGPVCTYSYITSDGRWDSFSRIFNSMSGGVPRTTQSPIAISSIVPLGSTDLCKHTYYVQEIVGGSTNSLGYFNNRYHNDWVTIGTPTVETHPVTTREKVGTKKCGAGTKRCNVDGDVTRNITGVNYLKCQVK